MAALDDPSTEVLPASSPVVATASAAETGTLVGRSLGKFLIVEKLGRGGSGDVYRADQSALGRSAVVKVLRRGGAPSPTKIDRFLREARLASRLDHPYAAHVYAFGAESDGELWIAMEHVRGATLDELVARRGPIPPQIFGPLFGRLCEVVHTAHELGIVHRDIKGSNVMVIERAGQLLPKLLDFGIAKSETADAPPAPGEIASETELTQEGTTLGSPHYMSPEQWQRPADVDARADIYALGVLAYRCVSGSVPFRAIDRAALIESHLRAPPPPLPDYVPAAVVDAIVRALEKDPGARWQTALAFGEAIQRAVGSTSTVEVVPVFDPYTRDVWLRAGPQPLADAVARVASAPTTRDCEIAVRELVAITCRWLALLALATLHGTGGDAEVRARARDLVGRDDAQPWLELARAIARETARTGGPAGPATGVPGLTAAIAGSDALAALAERLAQQVDPVRTEILRSGRLDDAARSRSPGALALEVNGAADALRPLEPLLAYQLVVGRGDWAESWIGTRRRDRERVVVWGDALADGEVALLDAAGHVVVRLSPLAQVIAPLPSAEPELFLLWRGGRGPARLVAAPYGFEIDDEAAGVRLASLATEDSETDHDAADLVSPYPGLAAYREGDADRFVGREREVEALANRLVRAPMIAVLGPSGAGKSSFIHAGLLPRLEGNGYRVVTMRPGRHPMHALAGLPRVTGGSEKSDPEDSADSHDGSGTAARLRELGESAQRGLVIVIDQLEELVTLCGDPAERRRFADTLAAAADGSRAPVRVVVTLRDDFAAVIESEDSIRGRFEVFVLGPPPPEALRRIVVEPARRANVSVDPDVVDDMVAEVAGRPASLPLLSFTAAQLWRTRDKVARRITHDAYLALGGVAGALSAYADQVYDSLARKDQRLVRALFARLVASDGTRIPAPRAELEELPEAAPVLAHLIDARLLVVREDDDHDVVELVHECLAERWDRLARWRREDATDRAILGDVRAAARRWVETGRSADLLWRGEALAELRKLLAPRSSVALTDAERAFAAAADAADRRTRRLRVGALGALIVALGAVALVMAYLSLAAKHSRDEADARLTTSLVAQGTNLLGEGHELAALAYFAEALRRGADSVGLREMIAVASRGWRDEISTQSDAVAVAALPDGAGFVTGTRDSHVRWIGRDGKPAPGDLALGLGPISWMHAQGDHVMIVADHGVVAVAPVCCTVIARVPHDAFVHGATLGPGSDEIATLEQDGVHVYASDGTPRRAASPLPGKALSDIAFDASGTHALVWAETELVAIDLATMATRAVATDLRGDLGASADGTTFAYVDDARVLHLIDSGGAPLAPPIHPTNRASGAIVSPDGSRILAISEHEASVFDRAGTQIRNFTIATSAAALVRDDDVWTMTHDGKLRRYHAGALVASIPALASDLEGYDLSGDLLALLGSDTQLVVTRASAEQLRIVPLPCARTAQWAIQIGIMSMCTDGTVALNVGSHLLGRVPRIGDDTPMLAYDPASGVAAMYAGGAISVFDPAGATVATSTRVKPLDLHFEDPGHLLVLEAATGALWRWAYASDGWDRVMIAEHALAIAPVAGGGLVIAYEDGHVTCVVGGRETWHFEVGGRTASIAVSRDQRWLALQLTSGATAIANALTGEVTQRLAAADASDVQPSFDDTGELLIRPIGGVTSIWDRTTGLPLVSGLDLLAVPSGVVFGPHGSLELQGERTGTLDFARDERPAAAVVDDIACRVPLAIVHDRLEPVAPRCR